MEQLEKLLIAKELHFTVRMLKFMIVHLEKDLLLWLVWKGCQVEILFYLKRNMAAQLRFAKLYLNKAQDLWTENYTGDVWLYLAVEGP